MKENKRNEIEMKLNEREIKKFQNSGKAEI